MTDTATNTEYTIRLTSEEIAVLSILFDSLNIKLSDPAAVRIISGAHSLMNKINVAMAKK